MRVKRTDVVLQNSSKTELSVTNAMVASPYGLHLDVLSLLWRAVVHYLKCANSFSHQHCGRLHRAGCNCKARFMLPQSQR